jgi:predicted metal-dependent phosphotriesterase family hydrolase
MKRREFFATVLGGSVLTTGCQSLRRKGPSIQTVLGPIPASEFGFALTHEHVLCDFIGAEKTGQHRWDVEEVVRTMRPYLEALKSVGVSGFVDCTPAYIGRDPRVLKQLAQSTRMHIVTNTGYYGGANDKFVPNHAYGETAEQLAARWIAEWQHGIEGTGVKPGFMKIGVDEAKNGQLSEIDAKLVRPKRKFIVAHSDGHGLDINKQVADLGAWVSFDAISRRPLETHLKLVQRMLEQHADYLLLSHDNGWYAVGETQKIRPFTYLAERFLPALAKAGVLPATIRKLTVENPAAAFALQM